MRFVVGQVFENAASGRQSWPKLAMEAMLGTSASSIAAKSNGFFGRSFIVRGNGS
jgi:hypothetical protein